MKLIRELRPGMSGPDVRAMKRALKKTRYHKGIVMSRFFGKAAMRDLKKFQAAHGLTPDGIYGEKTHEKLLPYYDRYGKHLLSKAPKQSVAEKKFAELVHAMMVMTEHQAGYSLGAGHGYPLDRLPIDGDLYWDCSSSSSKVLRQVGLFPYLMAWLSWDFLNYGLPGKGELVTIYSNGYQGENSHVWIRLNGSKRYWRFDTSPHGDGGRGPELRRLPRLTWGFKPRHPGGM